MSRRRKATAEQVRKWQRQQEEKKERLMSLNHLAYISYHIDDKCKSNIASDDLEQFRFHLNQLFPKILPYERIFFGYKAYMGSDLFFQFSFTMERLTDNVLRQLLALGRKCDLYVSQNTFCSYKYRTAEYAQASKEIIIDIDYYTIEKYKHLSPDQMYQVMKNAGEFDEIEPSYAMGSGRGMYLAINTNLIFLRNRSIMHKLRRDVISALIKKFEKYGADPSGTDVSRINRVPGSINCKVEGLVSRANISHVTDEDTICNPNTGILARDLRLWNNYRILEDFSKRDPSLKSDPEYIERLQSSRPDSKAPVERNKKCYIIDFQNIKDKELPRYELLHLANILLPDRKKDKPKNYTRRKITGANTVRSLNEARIQDIFTQAIIKTKSGKELHRRHSLFLAAISYGNIGYHNDEKVFVKTYDYDFILSRLERLNSLFPAPLKHSVLRHYARYGARSRCRFPNVKFIDMLELDLIEQKHMTTLICSEIKAQRALEKKSQEKQERAEKKEKKISDRMNEVHELRLQGMSVKEIALEMTLGVATIYRTLKLIGDEREYINIEKDKSTPSALKSITFDNDTFTGQVSFYMILESIEKTEITCEDLYRDDNNPGLKRKTGPPGIEGETA